MIKSTFTIVLLHYQQEKYIQDALSSIAKQDYSKIELLIYDDHTDSFDFSKTKLWFDKQPHQNIEKVTWIQNEKNIGTVATIGEALKKSTGEYLLFLAADDILYDKSVISSYVENFQKKPETDMICSQCWMMDCKLQQKYYDFVTPNYQKKVNTMRCDELFKITMLGCVFASGATAYRRRLFKKITWDINYKLIEDWPLYLQCARKNIPFYYANFVGLCHRDGGISHNVDNSNKKKEYYQDLLQIYEKEILPFLSSLTIRKQQIVVDNYLNIYQQNVVEDCIEFSSSHYQVIKKLIFWKGKLRNLTQKLYTPKIILLQFYLFLIFLLISFIADSNIVLIIYIITQLPAIGLSFITFFNQLIKKTKKVRR